MVIPNCAITKTNAKTIEGCNPNNYHTGVDIESNLIYSAYDGTVMIANKGHLGLAVIVQTGMSFCVVYSHLASMKVKSGQYLSKGDQIGVADRYVHVELLKLAPTAWPVRIGQVTWYKTDPNEALTGTLSSANNAQFDSLGINTTSDFPSGVPDKVEGHIKFILSNNEGG